MADITIADLLQWERGLTFRPADLAPDTEAAARPISWAVSIRVAPPVIPTLRGAEIVIAPPPTLARLRETESLDRAGFLRMLANQPIAALMVDPAFAADPAGEVPLLITSGTFRPDAESVLNRLFTERRSELYRIGSELSRALSMASMAGAGLSALLDGAELVAGRPLALESAEGTFIAASIGAPEHEPLDASCCAAALALPAGSLMATADTAGHPWLAQGIFHERGRVGEVRGVVLAIAAARDTSTEVERLVLSQTANAVELVLGHAVPYAAGTRERWNRESLVADLVLGRLASREAADARARLVGLDPGQPARVALFASRTPGAALLARSFVADQRGQAAASIGDTEYVVIVTGEAALAGEPRELASALRSARAQGTDVVLGISELVASPSQAHVALEQARILARLAIGGTLREPLLRVDDVGQTGVHGLLLSLSTGANGDSRGVQRRLGTFAATLLAPLDEHDERRGSELVPTLDAYLDLGGALAQAADRLRIHRNTLSYRLGRIAELTGRDLADPGTRLLFQIALAVRALERVTRDE